MSKNHTVKITCSQCGKEHDFTVWDSVNTQLDPSLKEKARNGDLFRFVCPDCGHEAGIMYPCLYHQMEDNVMIYLVPNAQVELVRHTMTDQDGPMSELSSHYTKRIVTDPYDFAEKLFLLDCGMDDRVLELVKAVIRLILAEKHNEPDITAIRLYKNDEGELEYQVETADGRCGTIAFDEEMYLRMAEDAKDMIADDDEVIIDHAWAMKKLQS